MKSIFLHQAEELGFEPKSYSQYPPTGKILVRIDFLSWANTTQMLFFRQEGTGIRYHVPVELTPHDESTSLDTLHKFFPYAQRGDLCCITIGQNSYGQYVLQDASIVEQLPLCTRREQCQRSACCVFKN